MNEGWIKLSRKLKNHWIWQTENRLKWWIDILLTVNHTDAKILIKGQLVECKRGQSIRSLESWAKDWNVAKSTVRDFFKLLEKDQMLRVESLVFTTRITVCQYDDYQGEQNDEKTMRKRKENGSETMSIPKQEREECKKGKEGEENTTLLNFPFTSADFLKSWGELMKLIKWKTKPLTAIQKTLNQLSKYDEAFAIGLIDSAISGDYQGVVFSNTDEQYMKWKQKPKIILDRPPRPSKQHVWSESQQKWNVL